MPGPLDHVQLHLVTTLDHAVAFKRWLGERHENNLISVDTETSGLNPRAPGSRLRMVQFGDTRQGWAVPWEDWRGLALEALNGWDGMFGTHNWAFEARWLGVHSGFVFPRDRTIDTMLAAHIINPLGSGALKQLSVQHVDSRAAAGQSQLTQDFTHHGWDWDTVPVTHPSYWRYSALDAVLTSLLWDKWRPEMQTTYHDVFALEMSVRAVVSRMEMHGARIDLDYSKQKYRQLYDHADAIQAWGKEAFGVNLGSNQRLAELLVKEDERVREVMLLTSTGQHQVDKSLLAMLRNPENEFSTRVQVIADQALLMRNSRKFASTYFQHFVEDNYDGSVHAEIRTLGARTGRMCLPTTHGLVTQRGVVLPSEIQIGDYTLDWNGRWTAVTAVHQYDDQPINVLHNRYTTLACTDEHRWVTTAENFPAIAVERLGARARQSLHLAPESDFDFAVHEFGPLTERETFAAIVGFLVTDGRCSEGSTKGTGMRAYIYQEEKKFYREITSLLPDEAVMYDRITSVGDKHHEIRLRTRWLRSRLTASGLSVRPGSSLRHSEDLVRWVLGLSTGEVAAFLRAAWLADGRTEYPENPTLSCASPQVQYAIRLAAYRLGRTTSVSTQPPSPWGTKPREVIGFKRPIVGVRSLTVEQDRSDVWCVTTESGTFTAWGPEFGPYLTGNSVASPALQQIPKSSALVRNAFIPSEGNVLVTSDYSQIEMRILAELSRDADLQRAFRTADETGGDFFVEIGKQVYANPTFSKKNPRRNLIKSMMYGLAYGAGPAKMAETAAVTEASMRETVDALSTRYPGIGGFMHQVEMVGRARQEAEGQGYVVTKIGRRLPCDTNKVYTLTNYLIQSSAADVLKKSIIRLDAAGYDDFLVLPVHDEVVLDIPADYADQALRDVPLIMQELEHPVALTADADGPLDRWGRKYEVA